MNFLKNPKFASAISLTNLALLAFLLAGAGPGAKIHDELYARKFVLLGPDGKARGLWSSKNGADLIMTDQAGKPAILIYVDDRKKQNYGILLYTDPGKLAIGISAGDEPHVRVHDPNSQAVASIEIIGDKSGFVVMDKNGEFVWTAP